MVLSDASVSATSCAWQDMNCKLNGYVYLSNRFVASRSLEKLRTRFDF
jgi:hypothetical protein